MQEEQLEAAEREWFPALLLDVRYREDFPLRTVPRNHGLESGRAKAVVPVLLQAGCRTGSPRGSPQYRPFITM